MPPRLKKSKPKFHWSIVLYGPQGIGKTSLCARLPNPHFIVDKRERGIIKLTDRNIVPAPLGIRVATTWEKLFKFLDPSDFPKDTEHVIIESITGIEALCFSRVCRVHFGDDWYSFYDYHRGPRMAARAEVPDFVDAIADIEDAGFNVVLTGHAKTGTEKNPRGDDYLKYTVSCDGETLQKLKAWEAGMLFYHSEVIPDKKVKGLRAKVQDRVERAIYCNHSPLWDSKNWFNLPDQIEVGDSAETAAKALLEVLS